MAEHEPIPTLYKTSARGEIYLRVEEAKADTLLMCIEHLRDTGHVEAAEELETLWDRPPTTTEQKG